MRRTPLLTRTALGTAREAAGGPLLVHTAVRQRRSTIERRGHGRHSLADLLPTQRARPPVWQRRSSVEESWQRRDTHCALRRDTHRARRAARGVPRAACGASVERRAARARRRRLGRRVSELLLERRTCQSVCGPTPLSSARREDEQRHGIAQCLPGGGEGTHGAD